MASNPPPDAGSDAGTLQPENETIPAPPADLHRRELPLVTLAERAPALYRSHRLDRPYSPVAFNFRPIADRFNAPNGEYGVLYLAADPFAAFIETFGASMVTAARELRLVSESDLARRCLCRIDVDDPAGIRLVNLADGHGFSRLGIDGRISTTKQRHITRQWAMALWQHPEQPEGILYRACNDPARLAVMLFDRIGDVLRPTCEEHNVLRDARQLAAILDHYAVGLDPD
jgi:hypothetical protein